MLRALLLLAAIISLSQTADAQRYPRMGLGGGREVATKSLSGTISAVNGGNITWECEGKSMPLPYDRSTQLWVSGTGDPGFVSPGSIVSVTGTLRAETKMITGASLTVHVNPAQTAGNASRVVVHAADPTITVKGRLASLDPLVLSVMDGIVYVPARPEGINPDQVPPIVNASLQVKLADEKPETVRLELGSAPNLIAAGDSVTVTVREDRPTVASSIRVRKSEPLKSGRTKEDGDKKKETGKPAATAEGDKKPETAESAKPEMKEEGKPEMKEAGKSAEKEGAKEGAKEGSKAAEES